MTSIHRNCEIDAHGQPVGEESPATSQPLEPAQSTSAASSASGREVISGDLLVGRSRQGRDQLTAEEKLIRAI